jgi:histidine triad (HIT) family protein
MEITEDQLKNMSPEEIRELQKQNCIFCHIVAGRVQSKKIYEDEKVIAILDINPANPGHILLLPKEHYAILPQIPEEIIGHIFMVAKALSSASLRALKTQGTNIFVANGVSAGQKAPHFMVHVVPRKEEDGLSSFNLKRKELDDEEFDKLTTEIKRKFKELMGITKEDPVDLDTKEKIVDAEFSESEKEEKQPEKEEKKEQEEKHEDGIDLDSIAKVLLGGKE